MSIGIVKWTFLLCLASSQAVPQNVVPWSYEGASGPEHWGDLSPEYSACKTGKEQSPIDIRRVETTSLPPIQFDYKPAPLKLINNGHTVQVNYAPGNSITVGREKYELRQLHFHHPSEERIDGRAFDMVIHLVHADARGELAVVAIPLKRGVANTTIQKIWTSIPKAAGPEREIPGVQINASDLLPAQAAYFTYRGSLTTPPCTEGVTWLIVKTPVTISAEQLDVFAKIFPPNARPIQPLGVRIVRGTR